MNSEISCEENEKVEEMLESCIVKQIKTITSLGQFINEKKNYVAANIFDTSWLNEEKLKLAAILNNTCNLNEDNSSRNEENYIDLYNTLLEESIKQTQLIEHLEKGIKQHQLRIQEKTIFLKAIESNLESLQEIKEKDAAPINHVDTEKLNTKTKQLFQQTRHDMHYILNKCYEDTNMSEIVQRLTEAYMKGGDEKYIELSEFEAALSEVQLLLKSKLVIHSPYNYLKIKFDDFD